MLVLALAGMTLAASSAAQSAEPYPARPIKIVVPFTPGSGSDNSARVFGEQIASLLKQPAVVDNKPGANGVIALQYVKSQPADGYTVLLASNSPMAVNPLVMKDLGYDPVKDFKPVYGLARGMNVLVVSNESRFGTAKDLLAEAKSKPVYVATYSAGYELAASWLAKVSGSRFVNVPYKGQSPIMADIIGNQVDSAFIDLGGAMPLIKSGKLKALAVTGEARHPEFPNVPTVRELGFPEYVQYSWVSFYVRTGTPNEVITKLAEALAKAHSTDAARDLTVKSGGELMPYPPERMQQFHLEEIARFKKIALDANVKPE